MPKLTIDGREIEVAAGLTVMQACDQIGIELPRFCYHERLSISGNCRMCLVEMERAPRAIAACAMPVGDGMVIHTNTEKVKNMRRAVLEFLLINHPLDCPVCDQGGECDLQDITVNYGMDRGRFREKKRAVREKNYGPLIKPTMTRCIHCTRCIRFCREVAGVPELGGIGRGERMEVGTYVEKVLSSELSGNIIDLCPVGALTSRPYSFAARPWELKKTESVDVMDAVGSNIRVDSRGPAVMRVLPRINEDINEEWISDKTRFAYDGLKRQRLDTPYVRKNGKLTPATWDEALAAVAKGLKGLKAGEIAAIAGDMADGESMTALKDLLDSPNIDCRQDGAALDGSRRVGYIFNTTIAGIEQAGACLLIGTNPRLEAPIINARIRKRSRKGGFAIASVGPDVDLTYKYKHLGNDTNVLNEIASGSHLFAEALKKAVRPMLIVGMGALTRPDGGAVLSAARKIAEDCGMIRDNGGWNGFNILHTAAARVGGLDLGFLPGKGGLDAAGIIDGAANGVVKAVYLLGADEIDMSRLGDAFVIYQGHHGDAGASRADVILPGAAYTEKNATYVNTEGRVQRTSLAVFPPGEAREDWKIIRALSEVLGKTLPFDTLSQVRERMAEVNPVFAALNETKPAAWGAFGGDGKLDAAPFVSPIVNFYMTDPISRASATMAACTDVFAASKRGKTGTDG
ncbi:MAG: NADH-quinone oxidoreductase subunit G [Rhodospirillales bacterium RIFCSPLOWO2_12_FULL_58_28]|nr:MAG: NADH-quinone oxidoreductase subunit G [Rhodospirillales bacterium RIFCSPLOWO2_02_FULL_58_16]OHC79060.1 MAG: NADH-quinone oxidoreductase subunit G [Rhodospirillales bacterium RIFCSPLOWO2_12_FULL_58_28]